MKLRAPGRLRLGRAQDLGHNVRLRVISNPGPNGPGHGPSSWSSIAPSQAASENIQVQDESRVFALTLLATMILHCQWVPARHCTAKSECSCSGLRIPCHWHSSFMVRVRPATASGTAYYYCSGSLQVRGSRSHWQWQEPE